LHTTNILRKLLAIQQGNQKVTSLSLYATKKILTGMYGQQRKYFTL